MKRGIATTHEVPGVPAYKGGCRCAECRAAWAAYYRTLSRRRGVRTRAQFNASRRRKAEYPGKSEDRLVLLTPLGAAILSAAERKGRSGHDVVEALLRDHAAEAIVG